MLEAKGPCHQNTCSTPTHNDNITIELVSIDFVHLEKSHGVYEYILVTVDHFTRYVQTYATQKKSAKTAANKLYNYFILCFGSPIKYITTREASLRTNSLIDYNNFVTYPIHEQHHITPKGMAR